MIVTLNLSKPQQQTLMSCLLQAPEHTTTLEAALSTPGPSSGSFTLLLWPSWVRPQQAFPRSTARFGTYMQAREPHSLSRPEGFRSAQPRGSSFTYRSTTAGSLPPRSRGMQLGACEPKGSWTWHHVRDFAPSNTKIRAS